MSGINAHGSEADREKSRAAITSVAAAVLLTGMKLVVGFLTGSLGILAEAAHSALDLVAAVVTFIAVRVSGRPADPDHPYGHGKVENLSALFETVLLLATCAWIIYEAVLRLFYRHVEVDPSLWAFAIMGISIVVDINRSRLLYRVAKKYDSQALEADALHFSTDIWSSAVVIAGLILVLAGERWNISWLAQADAVAALVVAGIVIWVGMQLGRRTVTALLDGVPGALVNDVTRRLKNVPGVARVGRVRLRRSGPETFADLQLDVARDSSFEQIHVIASQAETAVREVLPGADVVVQVRPVRADHEALMTTVRVLAGQHGLGVHDIRVYHLGKGGLSVDLHLEVEDHLTLDQAHEVATRFEQAVKNTAPDVARIVTHIEPVCGRVDRSRSTAVGEAQVRKVLDRLSEEMGVRCEPHDMVLRRTGGEVCLSFHCTMDGDMPLTDAHTITERIEALLRAEVPRLGRVVIHVEPGREKS
ncbi:MAG: cation-efflux pump [Thermodesulfobacteriota bacterium]